MGKGTTSNPSGSTKPAASSSSSMSSISGIMRKAINLPLKNKKLTVPVFMLVLLPFLILVLLHYLIATPLMAKVEDGYENSSLNHQDLISLVVVEIPFVFVFCLLLLFASAITVMAIFSAHQGASIGLKEILLCIISTWKKIFVYGFYVSFLMISFIGATIILAQLTALMAVLAALAYPYLASICTLVLVISTLEDECHGKKAFTTAREIIRQEGFQGYILMLALMLLSIPVYALLYITSTDDDDENGLVTQFGFLLLSTVLFCLMISFNTVVHTWFYLDYKQRNGEKIEEHRIQYHSVPTATNIDT